MTDFEAILNDFERSLKIAGLKTRSQYMASIREFFEYIASRGIVYTAVNEGIASDWKAHLLSSERDPARSTINNKLNRLRKFYRYVYRKRLVSVNPFTSEHGLTVGRSLPKNILSVEDMGRLLDSFALVTHNDIMMKAIAELLYGSALRISEALDLRIGDVDFEAGVLHITDLKAGGVRMKRPATEASLRFLRRYMRESREKLLSSEDMKAERLFPRKRYTSIRCMLNHKLERESKRLGLATVTTHSFRHSSATHLLRAGAGIREVQAMLGHEEISSTERYTRVVKEDLKNVIEKCHPRETAESVKAEERREDDERDRIRKDQGDPR